MIWVFTLTNNNCSNGGRKKHTCTEEQQEYRFFQCGNEMPRWGQKICGKREKPYPGDPKPKAESRVYFSLSFLLGHTQSFCHALSPPSDYQILPILSVDVSRRLPLPPGSIGSSKITFWRGGLQPQHWARASLAHIWNFALPLPLLCIAEGCFSQVRLSQREAQEAGGSSGVLPCLPWCPLCSSSMAPWFPGPLALAQFQLLPVTLTPRLQQDLFSLSLQPRGEADSWAASMYPL